jgi:hypothetical protein
MGLKIDKIAIGASFCLGGASTDWLTVTDVSANFPRANIFCSMSAESSLKAGVGFESSTCVRGICSTVQELSTPIASGGFIAV